MKDNHDEGLIYSGKDFDLIKAAQNLALPNNAHTIALIDADLVDFKDELQQNKEVADIGYCPEESILFEGLSIEGHLQYYAAIKGIPSNYCKELITELLNDVNLLDKKEQLAVSLSQVNKRKLMVAIASLSKPSLLLMNEPIGISGAKKKFKLWSIVKKIARKVVFVSHFLDEVKKYSNIVGALSEKGVEYLGSLRKEYSSKQPLVADIEKDSKPTIEISFKMEADVKLGEVLQELKEKGMEYEIIKEGTRSALISINAIEEHELLNIIEQLKELIKNYTITYRH